MYHLRLVKGLSYTGVVAATRKQPDVFVEDKAIADKAVASGYFEVVEDAGKSKDTKAPKATDEPEKTLEEMTVPELESYAAYHDVSLKGISKKAGIIAKLKEELGDTVNEVDYGSPTMQELQER